MDRKYIEEHYIRYFGLTWDSWIDARQWVSPQWCRLVVWEYISLVYTLTYIDE